MTAETDLPNGYYAVAPGKLVNAVTWLDMRAPLQQPLAEPLRLQAATDLDRAACRALYAEIGTPWLWSRASPTTDPVPPDVFFALHDIGERIGIVEFGALDTADVEIAFFGLIPTATGGGLGRRMMAAALERAWRRAERVWLHTCTFDHPAALHFYQTCGFIPYATGFEIMDDPRRSGALPPDAAPHVPFIRIR